MCCWPCPDIRGLKPRPLPTPAGQGQHRAKTIQHHLLLQNDRVIIMYFETLWSLEVCYLVLLSPESTKQCQTCYSSSLQLLFCLQKNLHSDVKLFITCTLISNSLELALWYQTLGIFISWTLVSLPTPAGQGQHRAKTIQHHVFIKTIH